jgi:hypothetical protein
MAVTAQAMTRRFPPPWTGEELDACFVVRDHNGQQLAYVYFEDEPGPPVYFPNRAPGWIVSRAFLLFRATWKSFFICPV